MVILQETRYYHFYKTLHSVDIGFWKLVFINEIE